MSSSVCGNCNLESCDYCKSIPKFHGLMESFMKQSMDFLTRCKDLIRRIWQRNPLAATYLVIGSACVLFPLTLLLLFGVIATGITFSVFMLTNGAWIGFGALIAAASGVISLVMISLSYLAVGAVGVFIQRLRMKFGGSSSPSPPAATAGS